MVESGIKPSEGMVELTNIQSSIFNIQLLEIAIAPQCKNEWDKLSVLSRMLNVNIENQNSMIVNFRVGYNGSSNTTKFT